MKLLITLEQQFHKSHSTCNYYYNLEVLLIFTELI